ncbi:MAG: tetratricopeptide repeat protein [Deltaproteobacteria bacterium]|nr:tetratricopeptide repeat protein [Deltaproteobacteria bacterium]
MFSLLSWHTCISDFAGREKEINELEIWATGRQAVSVKFVTGEGGTGKSRLAAEFAERLNKRKWSAGFVDLRKAQSFPVEKQGTLLIVDYPEENRDGVTEFLRDLAGLGKRDRLRVLFLTRQQIDSWEEAIHNSNAADLVDMRPIDLGRLGASAAHKLYCSALERAAEEFETSPPPLSEEALACWLEQAPENNRPLFVVATALHSAIHPEDEVVGYSRAEVIGPLLKRELDRLQRIAVGRRANDPYVYSRLLALSAIADMVPIERVTEFAQDTNLELGFPEGVNLEAELSAAGLLAERAVRAPKPDILAAAFTVEVLAQKPSTAPELIWAALSLDIEGGLQRMARLSHDAEIVLGIHEHRMSKWFAKAVYGLPRRCAALEEFFSDVHLPLGWIDPAVAVWQTLLDEAGDDERKAYLLNNLSNHLRDAGDNTGALKAIREAVEVYRRLSKTNPVRYEPNLAIARNNLSNHLRDVGDNTGALKAIREAVEVYRRLSKTNPARYEPGLSMGLNNLSTHLSDTGDNAGALDAVREAVKVCRRLSEANPALHEPNLAIGLNNLSNRLRDVGDYAGALKAIREAVEVYRHLSEANPALHEPNLAIVLDNLSTHLSDTGDNAGALDAVREAVEVYRRLSEANPVRYEPNLAMGLNNLSNRLKDVGDNTGALEVIGEAVDVRRRLSEENPARHEADLVMSLNNLSNRLGDAGDNAGALEAIGEAVDIIRRLSEENPARHEPALASILNDQSVHLGNANDNAGALKAICEAVDIRRRLSEENPARHEADLATSLSNLSLLLSDGGDKD